MVEDPATLSLRFIVVTTSCISHLVISEMLFLSMLKELPITMPHAMLLAHPLWWAPSTLLACLECDNNRQMGPGCHSIWLYNHIPNTTSSTFPALTPLQGTLSQQYPWPRSGLLLQRSVIEPMFLSGSRVLFHLVPSPYENRWVATNSRPLSSRPFRMKAKVSYGYSGGHP